MRAPAGSDRKKKKRGRGRSWAAGWTLGRGVKRKGHRPARAVRAGGEEKGGGGPHDGVGQRQKTGWRGVGLRLEKKEGREEREGFGKEFSSFYFFSNSFLKLSKVLNSFKTFHLLNSFPKISNEFKNS
jgi:hypothetical protein